MSACFFRRAAGRCSALAWPPPTTPNQAKLSQVSYTSLADPRAQNDPEARPDHHRDQGRKRLHFQRRRGPETESDFDAQLNAWARLNLDRLTLAPGKTGGAGGGAIPEVKMTGTRDFTGDGSVDRTDTLTARITGEVVDNQAERPPWSSRPAS